MGDIFRKIFDKYLQKGDNESFDLETISELELKESFDDFKEKLEIITSSKNLSIEQELGISKLIEETKKTS